MKIALCGPVSLRLLINLIECDPEKVPHGYQYPLAAYMAQLLHARGHHVALVTSSEQVKKTTVLRGERIVVYLTPRRHRLYLFDGYARERGLMISALKQFKPEVVHAQWTYEFAHAAVDSGFPTLVTARDAPWRIARYSKNFVRCYRAMYSHWVIPKIKNLTAVSPYIARRIQARNNSCEEIKVIPNGLLKSFFVEEFEKKFTSESQRFVTVSSWGKLKNLKTLLRAFSIVRSNFPRATLTLIGSGLGINDLAAKWAIQMGCSTGVEFCGSFDHNVTLKLLKDSDGIFVHPSLEESFCMAIVEAMANGLPVIVLPDTGAPPFLVNYGKAGLVSESKSDQSLADAMLLLLRRPEVRRELAIAGYRHARKWFVLDTIVKKYLDRYSKVVKLHDWKIEKPVRS